MSNLSLATNPARRDILLREMRPTGRMGRKLIASMPVRTGNMRRSYQATPSGKDGIEISFPGAPYWVYQKTRQGVRLPVAIRQAFDNAASTRARETSRVESVLSADTLRGAADLYTASNVYKYRLARATLRRIGPSWSRAIGRALPNTPLPLGVRVFRLSLNIIRGIRRL